LNVTLRKKWAIALSVVAVVVTAVLLTIATIWARSQHTALPPLLFLNGALYKDTGYPASQEELDRRVYLGVIQSCVPSYERPKEEFQVNTEVFVGAPLYQAGEDIVIFYKELERRSWWEYQKLE